MNHYPLFADLRGRAVLVVGGGSVAQRKTEMLLRAGARVRVAAQGLNAVMRQWQQEEHIQVLGEHFDESQLDDVFFVIAATDNPELNRRIFQAAESRCRFANVVDDLPHCSFTVPSVIDRSPVQIAISTGGAAPVLARLLREQLEALLPQSLGAWAETARQWRGRVKAKLPELTQRRRFWEKLFADNAFRRLHESGRNAAADERVQQHLDDTPSTCGEVSLVGAGPGDAGLLTLKGLQRIQQADVVLYDALVSAEVLDLVRRDAEKVCVGKRAGQHSVKQEETNRLLLDYAKQGKRVVRLKGGDPFVFGRGGEELEVLQQAGVPFEVVPGITAALGATAYAGIPLTHREHAQTAMFITGHCRPDGHELNWSTLAQGRQTLAVYMGTIKAAELTEQLIRHGRAADTPVAVISHGTRANQQIFSGSLQQLPELAAAAPAPALMVIGETAALHHRLHWFGTPPQQFVGSSPITTE